MPATERGNGPEVGATVRRQPPKGDVVDHGLGDLAAGWHPHAVGVEHDLEHHGRMEGRAALSVVAKPAQQRLQVESVDHVRNEPSRMMLGEPVVQVGGQQQKLLLVVVSKVVAQLPLLSLNTLFSMNKLPERRLRLKSYRDVRQTGAEGDAFHAHESV